MFVPFESLPSTARVWVFQSNRPFSSSEVSIIESGLREFAEQWNAHGSPLNSSFRIGHRQFIILAADESRQAASGCSIDGSVRVLKDLEQKLGISLFDRSVVAFKVGDRIETVPLSGLKEKFTSGILNGDTLTFNNLVSTKSELETQWLLPAGSSWVRRYIANPLAKV